MDQERFEKALHFMKDSASKYAEAKATSEYLKEFRKSKKAMLINQAEIDGRKTQQERESYAYSHQEYLDLLEGLRVSICECERLRLLVKAAELQIESWRMSEMREMAEMKLR
jgi:hypothetical protein